MNAQPSPDCALQATIRRREFYQLDEETLLIQIQKSFPDELDRLKNAYAVEKGSPPKFLINGCKVKASPSETLYGAEYDEINRTLVGVLALRWLHNGDYETFTGGQPFNVRLHRDSFAWLQDLFHRQLRSPEDLFALVMSMIINDLGKDPNLEEKYYEVTGERLHGRNHDAILLESAHAGIIECLDMLDEVHREEVVLGLELGSELNAGQLAQAENVPINLEGLLDLKGHEHAFEMKFMEQILDVAGAAGHTDSTSAKNMIEPVFQAFKTSYEVSHDIIAGKYSLREGYDQVLTKRGNMLSVKGFRRLSVSNRDERALLRLLTMGRTADLDQAELFSNAFHALDQTHKTLLVDGLNIDGNDNETAVLPYYMPAMLSESLLNTRDLPQPNQERALTSLMRYLARVLKSTHADVPELPEGWLVDGESTIPGIVIERNMLKARETISSGDFRKNPDVLDELEVPKGQMLQRRRTSHSL